MNKEEFTSVFQSKLVSKKFQEMFDEMQISQAVMNLMTKNEQLKQKVNQLEKENQKLREEIIDKKYKILDFIKENKVKSYRVALSEDYDEEILLDEDDIDTLERIVKNEYDYENK